MKRFNCLIFPEPEVTRVSCSFLSSLACGYTWGHQWSYIYGCRYFTSCI